MNIHQIQNILTTTNISIYSRPHTSASELSNFIKPAPHVVHVTVSAALAVHAEQPVSPPFAAVVQPEATCQ